MERKGWSRNRRNVNRDKNRRIATHHGERGFFESAPIQPESERFRLNRSVSD